MTGPERISVEKRRALAAIRGDADRVYGDMTRAFQRLVEAELAEDDDMAGGASLDGAEEAVFGRRLRAIGAVLLVAVAGVLLWRAFGG